LFAKIENDLLADIDVAKQALEQQSLLQEAIATYEQEIQDLLREQAGIPKYVKVKQMPADCRYNKLKSESKLFMNTIRMIVYRAETAVANLMTPYYARSSEEVRMLVKEIIKNDADLIPDLPGKTLTVRLHSLSTPRANDMAKKLCPILNETETVFPGTDLRMVYETV
jgi:hypothetical protein